MARSGRQNIQHVFRGDGHRLRAHALQGDVVIGHGRHVDLGGSWFPRTHRPYKTKVLALRVSYARLHPYLRSHATATNA